MAKSIVSPFDNGLLCGKWTVEIEGVAGRDVSESEGPALKRLAWSFAKLTGSSVAVNIRDAFHVLAINHSTRVITGRLKPKTPVMNLPKPDLVYIAEVEKMKAKKLGMVRVKVVEDKGVFGFQHSSMFSLDDYRF